MLGLATPHAIENTHDRALCHPKVPRFSLLDSSRSPIILAPGAMPYRDAVKTAKDRWQSAKDAVEARERTLSPADYADLPDKLRGELERLKANLEPAEDRVEAIVAAEEAVDRYGVALRDAIDVANQIKGAKARGETLIPKKARPLRWILGFAVSAVGGLVFAYGPGASIARADTRYQHCVTQLRHEAEAENCVQHAWLYAAHVFPWTRSRAARALREQRRGAAAKDLALAVSGTLPAESRDRRARRVVAEAEHLSQTEPVFELGAFAAYLEAPKELRDESLMWLSAMYLGDFEAMSAIARGLDARRTTDATLALRAGAWLCLNGEVDAGRTLLTRAATLRLPNDEDGAAALWGCGASADVLMLPDDETRNALLVLEGTAPREQRRAASRRWLGSTFYPTLHPAALAEAITLEAPGYADALAMVSPAVGNLREGDRLHVDPLVVLAPLRTTGSDWPHSPATLVSAAAHLEQLLLAEERAEQPTELAPDAMGPSAYRSPERTLAEVAQAFRIYAAVAYAREGRYDDARAVVLTLPRDFTWVLAAMARIANDPEAIRRDVAHVVSGNLDRGRPPLERAVLRALLAWAHERLGDAGRAVLLAERAAREGARTAVADELYWLVGALTVADTGLSPRSYDDPVSLGLAEGGDRHAAREAAVTGLPRLLLFDGYVLYLAGELAPGGGSPEVLLDRIHGASARFHGARGWQHYRARAEAARLRGDTAAHAHWRARAQGIRELVHDPRSWLLARGAGL